MSQPFVVPHPVTPLLWKVRNAPTYFLTSIHCAPPGGFDLGPVVSEIFDGAQQYVFELIV